MRQTIVRHALSLFIAFALILTCSSATFQPIAAYAAGDNAPAAGSGSISLTVSYDDGSGYTSGNLRSFFKLYRFPNGFADGEKTPVTVAAGNSYDFGPYTYDTSSSLTEMKEGASGTDDRTLEISSLPEGDYGLEEAHVSSGYAAYEGLRYFRVTSDASGWSVDYKPTNTAQDLGSSAIANPKTEFFVQISAYNGLSLESATFSVYGSNSDGSQSANKAKSPFGGDELTTTVHSGNSGDLTWDLSGIGANTYYLVQDAAPANKLLCKFKPVRFSVDLRGKLTVLSGDAQINDAILSVNNAPAQVTVLKLDQHAAGVAGATLQLQESEGGVWKPVSGAEWTTADKDEARRGHAFADLERETTYRIVETTVPSGYMQANHGDGSEGGQQMVEFTTSEYGDIVGVNLHNNGVLTDNLDWGSFNNSFDKVFTLRNERIVGQAAFTVCDTALRNGANKPLAGAQFDLYKKGSAPDGSDDVLVNQPDKHFTSDSDGQVTTETTLIDNVLTGEVMKRGLLPGTYYFKQVAAPTDFAFDAADPLTTDPFTIGKGQNQFTWKPGGTFGDFVSVTAGGGIVANAPLNAQLRLVNEDADAPGTRLIGAEFELRDQAGTVIDRQKTAKAGTTFTNTVRENDSNGNTPTAVSSEDGELAFVNVPAGTYTVVETTPAPGYQPSGESFTVQVAQSQANRVYSIGNDGVVTNARTKAFIDKVDCETPSHRLEGAQFRLSGTFADGSAEPIEWTSSADEAKLFDGQLVVGETYELTETKPLSGYVALPKAIAFRLADTGRIELLDNPAFSDGTQAALLSTDGSTLSVRNMKEPEGIPLGKTRQLLPTGDPLTPSRFAVACLAISGGCAAATTALIRRRNKR